MTVTSAAKSNFHLLWNNRAVGQGFRTGVSLHSHTNRSNESLGMIPRHTRNIPYLGSAIVKQEQSYLEKTGNRLDFNRAFWTPPLNPQQAYHLERTQLEADLGVAGFVSLSDHDNIEAGSMLAMVDRENFHPVSVEWTIPFSGTFFHVGVHNLPKQEARRIMSDLAVYTAQPRKALLGELFEELNRYPDVLVILNHPLWDESGAGEAEHNRLLGCLLERHGQWIHALELNGLRSWRENAGVIRLAAEVGQPIISGGDRHGCEPNAIVNLTNAADFPEFVSEIRYDRVSEVVFMNQYKEPLRLRILQTMWDIVRDYDEQPEGRKRWSDRVFYRGDDNSCQPLSEIWLGGGPAVVHQFLRVIRLVENRRVRSALRRALNEREEFAFEP